MLGEFARAHQGLNSPRSSSRSQTTGAFQYGVEQHIGSHSRPFRGYRFSLVVTQSADARNEDHSRRRLLEAKLVRHTRKLIDANKKCFAALLVIVAMLTASRSDLIFLVGNLLHPDDAHAIQSFLNSDVGHGGSSRCSVPMLVTRRAPDHVASTYFDNGFTFALSPSAACGDDKRLSERMSMPGAPRARFKRHAHH
jgi:hypothetical protein